jgi:non-ribosomal peptide synthetase component F
MFAMEFEGRVDCNWVYSSELFEASTIGNMAEMYETLVRDAVANPDTRVSALTLISAEQKKRLKEERLERKQSSQKKLMSAGVKAIGIESGVRE